MSILDWYINHPAGDLAEWWDKNEKKSEHRLNAFVDAHPHFWTVAAALQTCVDVTGGYVDVLRFGQGMASYHETGRVGPLIQDAFRGLTIASGTVKVLGSPTIAGRLGPALGRAIGIYEDVAPTKGICAPIAVANAIRRVGQRLVLSLDEIAIAHGRTGGIMSAECVTMEESISALKALKIQHEVISEAKSWENLGDLLSKRGGVVMVRIIGNKGAGAHRIVLEAMKDGTRIIDRSRIISNSGFTGFARALEDLSSRYPGPLNGGKWVLDRSWKAVLVKGATVRIIKGAPTLMAYVNALFPSLQGHYTTKHLDTHLQKFAAQ